jgi:hypothetical protein
MNISSYGIAGASADSWGHASEDIPSAPLDALGDYRRLPAPAVAVPDAEPEALRRQMPPPKPFPVEALGPVLGAAASRIHEVIRAPLAMCGQSVLAAAALAAQPHADVEIDGRTYLLSLFQLTVGESGERKSAVDRASLAVHKAIERERLKRYALELETWKEDSAAWEPKDGPTPQKPIPPHLTVSTPTLEAVHKAYMDGLPSIGLFHDDGGEFIGGHAMNKDNRIKTAGGLCGLWDDGEFDRMRATDDTCVGKYYGRRMAMYLQIQPVVAETVLSDDVLCRQGLLGRFLLSWPVSTIGTRHYVRANLTHSPDMVAYYGRMRELLELKPRLEEGGDGALAPRLLTLTEDAHTRWVSIHDAIEDDQRPGGAWFTVRPWASKAAEQVLRIAGTLALVEGPQATEITLNVINRAALLVTHYLAEAVRIIGTAGTPPRLAHAEALLNWCHENGHKEICSESTMRLGPSCIRNVSVFNVAIAELEATGWAEPAPGLVVDGKRRKRAWKVRERRA